MYLGSSCKQRCKALIAAAFFLPPPELTPLSELSADPDPPSNKDSIFSFLSFGPASLLAIVARCTIACFISRSAVVSVWLGPPGSAERSSSSRSPSSLSLRGPVCLTVFEPGRLGSSSKRRGRCWRIPDISRRCPSGTPAAKAARTASASRPAKSDFTFFPAASAPDLGAFFARGPARSRGSAEAAPPWDLPNSSWRPAWIWPMLSSKAWMRLSCWGWKAGGQSGTWDSAVKNPNWACEISTKAFANGTYTSPTGENTTSHSPSLVKSNKGSSSGFKRPNHTLHSTPSSEATVRLSAKELATEHKTGLPRALVGSARFAGFLSQTSSGNPTSKRPSTSATAITAHTRPSVRPKWPTLNS